MVNFSKKSSFMIKITYCTNEIFTFNLVCYNVSWVFITVRNEVAKVMFLQACVCPRGVSASVHAGIPPPRRADTPLGADTPPEQTPLQEQTPPIPTGEDTPQGADTPSSPRDGHCCGRYASYWNAFLYLTIL